MGSIIAIPATASNCDNNGGIKYSYGTDAENITGVTVGANGEITGFTMDSIGLWAKHVFDDDDNVAFFNQEGTQNGSSTEFNQNANWQFNGINQTKIEALNLAKACCGTVWIHFHEDGTVTVQGIEVDNSQNWALTKNRAKVVPSANSGTGNENNIMIVNVVSVSRFLAPTCTLDEAAIEAL